MAASVSLVYVTSRFPFGPGEAFLAPEITAHLDAGADLRLFPMVAKGGLVHRDAAMFLDRTEGWQLGRTFTAAVGGAVAEAGVMSRAALLAARSGSRAACARNLAVLTRVGALIQVLRRVEANHVHVHWGGASSTLAMMAAEAVGIPWSMTLHRWDIAANNLLRAKIESACFTRVISHAAVADVRAIVPDAELHVIHMGVTVCEEPAPVPIAGGACRLLNIASFVPVKNHRDLLYAFQQVAEASDVTLDLVGDGPLGPEIRELVTTLGVDRKVSLLGTVDHEELLRRLRGGEWDGVVLTSTGKGTAHEGIPVSLMEAMAAGVAVVATDSGGVRELVVEGAGLLVPLDDRQTLTSALRRFVCDRELRARLALGGRRRIADAFDVDATSSELRRLIAACPS